MNAPRSAELPLPVAELARLARNPGPFMLLLDARGNEDTRLRCRRVVRAIPGKRLVCEGEWQGEAVFVKLYIGAQRLFRKELQGLRALHAAGIAAPAIRYSGTAGEGAVHVILLEPVAPATTLEAAWEAAADEPARIALLEKSLATIAAHHRAGLEQLDIHLDNFLLSGERLVTLDGGAIHIGPEEGLSARHARDNLALFFAQLPPCNDHLVAALLPVYETRRGYRPGTIPAARLRARVDYFRRNRQRRYLRKIFRDCSAFRVSSSLRRFSVCDRSLASAEILALLADPDASLQQAEAQFLKQGNTCTLWQARAGAYTLVVKRYNIKGFWHRLGRLLRPTRAAVSWKNAHRLGFFGIPTPQPVALVEERFGPLRGRAWYVSVFVAGDDARRLCDPSAGGSADAQAAAAGIVGILQRLARCRISHGDMKASNFILSTRGATVIDLDAMKQHDRASAFARAQRRDLRRFMRNWEGCPETAAMFRRLLREQGLVAGE